MVIKVYDYANRPVEVELPDKEISNIFIHILSGDETGHIVFTDGDSVEFDSSNSRCFVFDDGSYAVSGEKINEWINFKPSGERTVSYERQSYFCGWED